MSIIFLLCTLQLPEYVGDLTIKTDEKDSDEKLNLKVRVCCLFLSPVLIELFSNKVKLTIFFFSLSTAPWLCARSDYQQVKIHKIHSFNVSRRIESCCNASSMIVLPTTYQLYVMLLIHLSIYSIHYLIIKL